MPRSARQAPGGLVYHVLNRAVARLTLFARESDSDAFERILAEAEEKHPLRLLAYCLMPNHWHLVLWPRAAGESSAYLRWLTLTHAMRWHVHSHTAGTGHLDQGRFKSFPVESDEHLSSVIRSVERNPLRANLVARAEQWRWSSLGRRCRGDARTGPRLEAWPMPLPEDWVERVNQAQSEAEVKALRRSAARGTPFGAPSWQRRTAQRLGLEFSLRPRGRPRKVPDSPEDES